MGYLRNCANYLNQPNLLLIVKSNKKIEDKESIDPNTINDFDFSLLFFSGFILDENSFLSLSFLIRFEKGLFTLKNNFRNY